MTKEKSTRNTYKEEFKKMIVEQYLAGSTLYDLYKTYGPNEATIRNWVHKYSSIILQDGSSITMQEYYNTKKEIKKLELEIVKLRELISLYWDENVQKN